MSRPNPAFLGAIMSGALCLPTTTGFAAEGANLPSPWSYSADVRLRYEWDWDSQTSAGIARSDRDRARYRVRANLGYTFSETWSFGTRARTGNRDSQQSPHLTFHSNDGGTDDLEVALDRYYLLFKQGSFQAWGGRNTTPFWQQNEMFWDEDVTPTGLAFIHTTELTTGSLTTAAGAFYLPDGMTRLHGTLAGGQLKYSRPLAPAQLTLAAGLYRFDGMNGAENLRNRNGARDYLLGVLSAQWTAPLGSGRPLTFGADLIKNFENYTATDALPFGPRHADETDGHVLSILYGQLKKTGDWQLGWFYSRIETFAVNAAYAQDDWARFGSATQADLTDFKGHEFRASYVITPNLNLVVRYFAVEAITSNQDGQRGRIDLNWKF